MPRRPNPYSRFPQSLLEGLLKCPKHLVGSVLKQFSEHFLGSSVTPHLRRNKRAERLRRSAPLECSYVPMNELKDVDDMNE